MQGDLTDPLYFDFISFCQSATLRQEMQRAKQTFQVRLLQHPCRIEPSCFKASPRLLAIRPHAALPVATVVPALIAPLHGIPDQQVEATASWLTLFQCRRNTAQSARTLGA